MATKTISIELDVYERLKALKRAPSESFSQVLRRELAPKGPMRAAEILRMVSEGTYPRVGLTEEQLSLIEAVDTQLELGRGD